MRHSASQRCRIPLAAALFLIPSIVWGRPTDSATSAEAALARRDWIQARDLATSTLAADPTELAAFRVRGWALYRLHDYTGALQDFQSLLSQRPEDYDALLGSGRCHRLLKNYDEAVHDFTRAHEVSPSEARPLCERGALMLLLEKWDAALADYSAAEAINPNYPGLYSYFAEVYLYLRKPDLALAATQKGLGREPNLLIHQINLAHSYLFLGQGDPARAQYAKIKDKMDPDKQISGAEIVLKDFALLRAARVTCPGMDEIETAMKSRDHSSRNEVPPAGLEGERGVLDERMSENTAWAESSPCPHPSLLSLMAGRTV